MHEILASMGEVAALLGVSAETIRFYEKNGLEKRHLTKANGYREFPLESLSELYYIRELRQMGATVKEAIELASGSTPDVLRSRLDSYATSLESRIAFDTVVLNAIKERKRDLEGMVEKADLYSVQESPAYFFVGCTRGGELAIEGKATDLVQTWAQLSPPVRFVFHIDTHDIRPGCACDVGLAIM